MSDNSLELLKNLHEYSFRLADMEESGLYDYMTSESKKMFGLRASWASSYNSEKSELTIRSASFYDDDLSKLNQFMESRLQGSIIKIQPENLKYMYEHPISDALSLKEAAFGFFPEFLCSIIQKSLSVGWIIGISLVTHEKLLGNIMFVGSSGQKVPEKEELMIFRAITSGAIAKRYAEKKLMEAKEEAELANFAKSEFLANMSHEIRTPLSSIVGFSELLEKTTNLDSVQKEYIRSLKTSAGILMNLINDTLDLSKIEAGKLEIKPEKTDLKAIFKDVYDSVYPLAKSKKLKIYMNLPERMPECVLADSLRLKQILINLVGNAIKFTEKGFVRLKMEYSGEVCGKNSHAFVISVEDTGIGIDAEKQKKILELFYQVDSSSTRRYGGSGLGLTITDRLLKLMGSRLEISSSAGKGSVFSFRIELTSVGKSLPDKNQEDMQAIPDSFCFPKKALVVDDNKLNLFLTSKILKLAVPDIEIIQAEDGFTALEYNKTVALDLILLDIQMPDISGFDIAKNIRSDGNHLQPKIIAVSADVMKCDEKICRETGIDAFICKPFTKIDLINVIAKVYTKNSTD